MALATGATFRRDGRGRNHPRGIPIGEGARVLTPDDIFDGKTAHGAVVVYDDEHYALGTAIAEKLAREGHAVTLVTPAPLVSYWTHNTLEQGFIEQRLVEVGVRILTRGVASGIEAGRFDYTNGVTGEAGSMAAETVVLVASREPNLELFHALKAREAEWADAGVETVTVIGDALTPGMIVHATYAGHRYARELDCPVDADAVPFLRDLPA